MSWPIIYAGAIVIVSYVIVEVVFSIIGEAPKAIGYRLFSVIRRLFKELLYLRRIVRDDRFAQWKPHVGRYVALSAIKARPNDFSKSDPEPVIALLWQHLNQRQSVLILGKPGAGKTTAMRALVFAMAAEAYNKSRITWLLWLLASGGWVVAISPPLGLALFVFFAFAGSQLRLWSVPFYVELRSFFGPNAFDFLAAAIKDEIAEDIVLRRRSRYVFFLDGTNEIDQRESSKFIETWRNVQTKRPVAVFTCRDGEEPSLDVPVHLNVCDLDDRGVMAFLKVYLQEKASAENRVVNDTTVSTLFKELQQISLLGEGGIGRNPYWLRMLALSGLTTRNRGELFLKFTRALIRRETVDLPQGRLQKWNPVELDVEMESLAELALAMSLEGRIGFEGKAKWDAAHTILREAMGDRKERADDVLEEAQAGTLLRFRYREVIAFSHQLVQEFFAAYALRKEERWPIAIKKCEEQWWWQTLFLLGGLIASSEGNGSTESWARFTNALLDSGTDESRLFVAVGLLQNVDAPDPDTSRRILNSLVLSDKALTLKYRTAVRELERILGDEVTRLFGAMLDNSDPRIKANGVGLLCVSGTPRATEMLMAALRNRTTSEATIQSLENLGELAFDILSLGLRDQLSHGLQGPNYNLRPRLVRAIGKSGEAALDLLMTLLEDKDWSVGSEAKKALVRIGAPAIPSLIAALQNPAVDPRLAAAEALGQLKAREAVEPLIVAMQGKPAAVRKKALNALVLIGPPAIEPLSALWRDERAWVRWCVVHTLGRIGDVRQRDVLISALRDQDFGVREEAVRHLGRMGDSSAVEPLIAALARNDGSIHRRAFLLREEIADALGSIGDTRAVEPLIAALNDPEPSVRARVAKALGNLGDIRALDPLRASLGKPGMKKQAATAIGKIRKRIAVDS